LMDKGKTKVTSPGAPSVASVCGETVGSA